jgi:hypothetical protein
VLDSGFDKGLQPGSDILTTYSDASNQEMFALVALRQASKAKSVAIKPQIAAFSRMTGVVRKFYVKKVRITSAIFLFEIL